MEQDCIVGLYRSLGLSVGAEFSSEDVSLLYRKVFHVSSDTDEAHSAMKKIAGGDQSWSCVGENVLEVLLEMEREREKKEKLYWDLQLLNIGNLGIFCATDKPALVHPHSLTCLRQNIKTHHQSDSQSFQSGAYILQRERPVGKKEPDVSARAVKRLKKAARQCWARLASEGVQSVLLPSPWQSQSLEVRGQAWGCVTLSDVLLLVEVKYDVVAHLLYTEMLQEHYTPGIWENLLPWQQQKEEEGLEDLAVEALESGDMLGLAELPGAFRMYRSFLEISADSSCESREQSWSAVSLLCELNMFRQQEKETVTVLGKRLDRDNLTLLCLNIRLATLRAQREKTSHAALLAARQCWETWPHIKSPCKAEQAALWLHGDEEDQERDFISLSPQQAVLQLLVLTQEQERKHLLKLVHGLSPEDLQEPGCRVPRREEGRAQAAYRDGCIKKLRQIRVDLQKQDETKVNFKQINPEPQHRINSESTMWSQRQLEDCSVLLLTQLMELHEVQASATLPALMDKSEQRIKTLRDDYESELQAQRCTGTIQLLISDASLASGVAPYPNFAENSSDGPIAAQPGSSGPVDAQTGSGGPAEAQVIDSTRGPGVDLNVVQATVGTSRQDVCAGCGVAMEELPYLEILCVPDTTNNTHQGLAAEGGAEEDQEGSATKSPQNYEKQASLITLAWSKPPDDDTDGEAEAAGKSRDGEGSLETRVQPSDVSSTADEHTPSEETSGESDREELRPPDFPESIDQQCSTVRELKPEERATADYPDKGEAVCEYDPLTEGATPQAVHKHLLVDLPEIKRHTGDLCSGLTSEGGAEAEICPTTAESAPWDLRGSEDQEYNSQAGVDCSPAERESTLMERVTEPVSAMERERTMRNLVDMQRKVEQRQQRDRERQLLRVQERLSIVQNRKAEEDLLGLKLTDRLRHLTQDLPQEDKNQQKTVVRERLEQLRRERSNVMQSKRDRNTAVFKELLGPVALHSTDTEEGDN